MLSTVSTCLPRLPAAALRGVADRIGEGGMLAHQSRDGPLVHPLGPPPPVTKEAPLNQSSSRTAAAYAASDPDKPPPRARWRSPRRSILRLAPSLRAAQSPSRPAGARIPCRARPPPPSGP